MKQKELIRETAEEMVKILKEEKLIEGKTLNSYQKVEKILYELRYLKGAIDTKEKLVLELQNGGELVSKKEIGLNVQESKKYLSELEKRENRIEKVKSEINHLQKVIEFVESALKTIEQDKYYKIIELKYFDDMTNEYIAEQLDISEKTVRRHRNHLIRKLRMCMFSEDLIKELLE